jgi:uncharacterized protein YcfJ
MLLNELTDMQVAGAFIDKDMTQRRVDNAKTPQQLAKERGAQITADKVSKDPLKIRIAQLRQQLAALMIQDQKKTQDAAKLGGAQLGAAPGGVAQP